MNSSSMYNIFNSAQLRKNIKFCTVYVYYICLWFKDQYKKWEWEWEFIIQKIQKNA